MYGVHVDVFTNHKSLQYVFTQKELILRQRRFLELLKDYDMGVLYHPEKANVFVDSLNRMTMGSVSHLDEAKKHLPKKVNRLGRLWVRLESSLDGGAIVHHNSKSSLMVEVKSEQHLDLAIIELTESVLGKSNESFSLRDMVC